MRRIFNPAIELPFSRALGVNQKTPCFSAQTHRKYKNKGGGQIGGVLGLGQQRPAGVLGSVVIFTVIPAKAGIQRPLAANAYLPATGFQVPAFAGMTETDAWRPIFLN